MAIHVEIKITHGNEPKRLHEVVFKDKSWNDNPFLHEQDLKEIFEAILPVYGMMLEGAGYPQTHDPYRNSQE